jgi:hypothetical protein
MLLFFLSTGFVVPFLIEFLVMLLGGLPGWLILTLWPGYGFVMAADDRQVWFGFFLSIIANVLVYGIVGGLFSLTVAGISKLLSFWKPETETKKLKPAIDGLSRI